MHFLCDDTTLKKKYIVNRKAEFNKLSPLPRVSQIVLTGRGMGNLPGGVFLLGGGNLTRSDFGYSNLFQR